MSLIGSDPPDTVLAVGHGAGVAVRRILAIASPRSAPVRRAVRQARVDGRLIDLTFGRRALAVLFLDSGHVVRVALSAEAILARWSRSEAKEDG